MARMKLNGHALHDHLREDDNAENYTINGRGKDYIIASSENNSTCRKLEKSSQNHTQHEFVGGWFATAAATPIFPRLRSVVVIITE